ncbi:protein asteroid homolog 1-like [Ruditapes philippinarum]|uniref:protein asteroid homolog 1-like n=1 Tax=Ruditapes philippinarum TaxID=129788 RepID=UPI00295A6F00|nr:protein asteroid homolog 1-like [Ruditapes philippinarum]
MGVRGLRSYIQEHRDKFLQDFKLKDTKLVIDGSNLLYFLNSHFEEENIYGGNYDHFNTKCRDFFNTLLKCKILPIVVFDGADDPDNMKLETILKRLDARFSRVKKWKTKEILPILSKPLLYQILDELKVPHIATVYEADKEIAVLASRYECPVVTNDSDFYVYDLKGGSISMACMIEKERMDVNGSFYIPVKLYRREAVLKELFKMENDELIFPVFATLTGNDFFDPSSITLNYPKRPREQMSFARRNIRVVVEYVCRAEFESGQKAYDYICSQLSQAQREQFKYSVDSYLDTKQFTLFDLEAFIANLTHGHSKEISILYERPSTEGNLSLQELSLDEPEKLETEPSSSTDDSASMPRQAHNHRQQDEKYMKILSLEAYHYKIKTETTYHPGLLMRL